MSDEISALLYQLQVQQAAQTVMLEDIYLYLLRTHPNPAAALGEMQAISESNIQSRRDNIPLKTGKPLDAKDTAFIEHVASETVRRRAVLLALLDLFSPQGMGSGKAQ